MPVDPECVFACDCDDGTRLLTTEGDVITVTSGDENYYDACGWVTHRSSCPNAEDEKEK